MGMPITVNVAAEHCGQAIDRVFEYFSYVDGVFSTYKDDSDITMINLGRLSIENAGPDVREIFRMSEETKRATDGYFDIINRQGKYDPSGIVKGWAIRNAASILTKAGYADYYVEAGGDIQPRGLNEGKPWSVGIRNPFNREEIVKIIFPGDRGLATSGTYMRGQHIYNPKDKNAEIGDIVSLTVIGPDIYEADRFATAAFAMGRRGIEFIGTLPGFEGYMIDAGGRATMTVGFKKYTRRPANAIT